MLAAAEVNWGVGTLVLLGAGGAIAVAARGFSATNRLDERFSARLDRVRAAIEGENVVPTIIDLMRGVIRSLPLGALDDPDALPEYIRTGLQEVEVIPELRKLTGLGSDYADTDRLYGNMEKAEHIRGWAAIGFLVSGIAPSADAMLTRRHVPEELVVASLPVFILSAIVIVIAWILATTSASRITRLCRKYERAR